ncbi:MAG TPA: hypothetical protein ENK35_07695 [Candidatus Tenderia sp.]|nr:hypothetical protein [Candidatus Tenderia sp.]
MAITCAAFPPLSDDLLPWPAMPQAVYTDAFFPRANMAKVSAILLCGCAALLVLGLSGCGQKGDLYFPEQRTQLHS